MIIYTIDTHFVKDNLGDFDMILAIYVVSHGICTDYQIFLLLVLIQ